MNRFTRLSLVRTSLVLGSLVALAISSTSAYSSKPGSSKTSQSRLAVTLDEVPLTGPAVIGSAAIHEHVMAEHAFSGKWHWGSVGGSEKTGLGLCDGDGETHGSAFGLCSGFAYIFGGKDGLGRDTCCHSGGLGDCNYKATNGNDPDAGDEKWDYLDWPIWDTQAHPRYWHGHLKKAHQAGLKLMVVYAVENYLLCSLVSKGVSKQHPLRGDGYPCDHGDAFNSVKRQIEKLKLFAFFHSDFMQIAYTPEQARQIINKGKMAIVIGVEADYAWGNEKTPIDLLQRLNDYYALGARSIFLAHQLNTRLAGAALYVPAVWAQQSFANCLFLDKQCTDSNPDVPSDPGHAYEVRQSRGCCGLVPCYAKNYRQMCAETFSRGANPENWDGFAGYPGGGVFTEREVNYQGFGVSVRKNRLGLTNEGAGVVNAMMNKGMLVEIGHLSENAVSAVYEISQQAFNYPLIASHGYSRRMLFDTEAKTEVANKHYASADSEFALGDSTLEKIRTTEGILGHFIAPDPVPTYGGSNVPNNCPRSTRSLAQLISYAVDKGVRVAWAGDFMGFGSGVAPRRGFSNNPRDWCGGTEAFQNVQGEKLNPHLNLVSDKSDAVKDRIYFGTRGFAHFGLLEAFHDDLAEIGLPSRILNQFRSRAAENFIRTWEKSEYISKKLVQNQ